MPKFFLQYDENGMVRRACKIESNTVLDQPGQVEVDEERFKAGEAEIQAEILAVQQARRLPGDVEIFNRFWDQPSPIRAAIEWICEKLSIEDETAKQEILAKFGARRALNQRGGI